MTLKAIDSKETSKFFSTEMVCKSTIPASMSVNMHEVTLTFFCSPQLQECK